MCFGHIFLRNFCFEKFLRCLSEGRVCAERVEAIVILDMSGEGLGGTESPFGFWTN